MKTSQILFLLIFALISCKNVSEKNIAYNTIPQLETDLIAKASEIHKRVLTVDTHNDINIKNFTNDVNYTQELDNQVNKIINSRNPSDWQIVSGWIFNKK